MRIRDIGWKIFGSGIWDKHPGNTVIYQKDIVLIRVADPDPDFLRKPDPEPHSNKKNFVLKNLYFIYITT
jgi:hypothetical protein